MKLRIWVTKDSNLSGCIMIWFKKPIWHPNKKNPQDKNSGCWLSKNGSLNGQPLFWNAFNGLFEISFSKVKNGGYISERIISLNLPEKSKRRELI